MSKVRLNIDGREIEARQGEMLLDAALAAGIYIPYFCSHPLLSRPANCRMCLVEIEGLPKLTPSCMTPVKDGMVVRTNTPRVLESHRSVMEFYLTNHPLDCPVCDQSGECVLQDYSWSYGSPVSRFEDVKVTQPIKDVGADILLYQDRCIMCTRCVRFLREISGTGELVVVKRGVYNEIHADQGRRVDNPLAGNVVDICPVGALLSRDFLFKCRVWWLKSTASACALCARACSIRIDTNSGLVMRLKPRENMDVNGTWMCDFGRFAFKGWQHDDRLDEPLIRRDDRLAPATWNEALKAATRIIRQAIQQHGPGAVAFAASPWMSCEEAMLLAKLMTSFDIDTAALWQAPGEQPMQFPGFRISGEKAWNRRGVEKALADVGARAVDIADLARAVAAGRVKTLYMVGGAAVDQNFIPPDFPFARLDNLILHDCFLRCEVADHASVVLPGASPYEKTGSVINEDGLTQEVNQALDPPGQARPDWDILRHLAQHMADNGQFAAMPAALAARDGSRWTYTRGNSENE